MGPSPTLIDFRLPCFRVIWRAWWDLTIRVSFWEGRLARHPEEGDLNPFHVSAVGFDAVGELPLLFGGHRCFASQAGNVFGAEDGDGRRRLAGGEV